jgi:hypothetical protein
MIGENIPTEMQSSLPIALQKESPNLLNNYSILKVTNVVIYGGIKKKIDAHLMSLHE